MQIMGIVAIVLGVVGLGSYAYLRAAKDFEHLLDWYIEHRKRKQGGYYKRINPNDWCPACGAKAGEIFYNPTIQKVIHTCAVCDAPWPENTRVPASAWDFLGRDLAFAGERKEDLQAVLARANAPIKLGTQSEQKEQKDTAVN